MALSPISGSRWLLLGAFLAVASSAGLQWAGLSAQSEAVRQQASRQTLAEFSSALNRFESATPQERPAVAEHLTGMADRLSRQTWAESLAPASRRVAALTSYEARKDDHEKQIQDRLRAEVRGLVSQAESLEAAALGRATLLSTINQALLVLAAVLCGLLVFRTRRASSPA